MAEAPLRRMNAFDDSSPVAAQDQGQDHGSATRLRQPWLDYILEGSKTMELRSRKYRAGVAWLALGARSMAAVYPQPVHGLYPFVSKSVFRQIVFCFACSQRVAPLGHDAAKKSPREIGDHDVRMVQAVALTVDELRAREPVASRQRDPLRGSVWVG